MASAQEPDSEITAEKCDVYFSESVDGKEAESELAVSQTCVLTTEVTTITTSIAENAFPGIYGQTDGNRRILANIGNTEGNLDNNVSVEAVAVSEDPEDIGDNVKRSLNHEVCSYQDDEVGASRNTEGASLVVAMDYNYDMPSVPTQGLEELEEEQDHQGEGISDGEVEHDHVSQSENAEADQYLVMESGDSESLGNPEPDNEERYEPEGQYGLGREFPGAGAQGGADLYGQVRPRPPHDNSIHQWVLQVDPNPHPEDDQDTQRVPPLPSAAPPPPAYPGAIYNNAQVILPLKSDFIPGAENTYSYAPVATSITEKPFSLSMTGETSSPNHGAHRNPGQRLPTQGMASPDSAPTSAHNPGEHAADRLADDSDILDNFNHQGSEACEILPGRDGESDGSTHVGVRDTDSGQKTLPVGQHVGGDSKQRERVPIRPQLRTELRAAARSEKALASVTTKVADGCGESRGREGRKGALNQSSGARGGGGNQTSKTQPRELNKRAESSDLVGKSITVDTEKPAEKELNTSFKDCTQPPPPYSIPNSDLLLSPGAAPASCKQDPSALSKTAGYVTGGLAALPSVTSLGPQFSVPLAHLGFEEQGMNSLLQQSSGLRALQELLQSFSYPSQKEHLSEVPNVVHAGHSPDGATSLRQDPWPRKDGADTGNMTSSLNQGLDRSLLLPGQSVDVTLSEPQETVKVQWLRDCLDRETYRRKHCEQKIQELQKKILELNQQMAVGVETEHRKDKMIEHLDAALASVVENWRREDGERQRRVQVLTLENTQLQQQQHIHQKSLLKFEEELRTTVDRLAEEKKRSEQAEIAREKLLKEKERHVKDLEHDFEEQKLLAQEEQGELRVKLRELQQQAQHLKNLHSQDTETWEDKEFSMLEKVKKLTEALQTTKEELEEQVCRGRDYQTRLSVLLNDKAGLEHEVEELFKRHDSLKVQYGILENKMLEAVAQTKEDIAEKMNQQLQQHLEEQKGNFAREESILRSSHREQMAHLTEQHQQAMEQQLATFKLDRERREKRFEERETDLNSVILELKSESTEMKVSRDIHERERAELKQRLQALMQSHFNQALQIIQNSTPSSPLPSYTTATEKPQFMLTPAVKDSSREGSISKSSPNLCPSNSNPEISQRPTHPQELKLSSVTDLAVLCHDVPGPDLELSQQAVVSQSRLDAYQSASQSTLVVSPGQYTLPGFTSGTRSASPTPTQALINLTSQQQQPPGAPPPASVPRTPPQAFTLKPVHYSEVESDAYSSVHTTPQSKVREQAAANITPPRKWQEQEVHGGAEGGMEFSPPHREDGNTSMKSWFKDLSVQNYQGIEKIWKQIQEDKPPDGMADGSGDALISQQLPPQEARLEPSINARSSAVPASYEGSWTGNEGAGRSDKSSQHQDRAGFPGVEASLARLGASQGESAKDPDKNVYLAAEAQPAGSLPGPLAGAERLGKNIFFHPPLTLDSSGSGHANSSGSQDDKSHTSKSSAGYASSFSHKFDLYETRQAELQKYIKLLLDRPPGATSEAAASLPTSLPTTSQTDDKGAAQLENHFLPLTDASVLTATLLSQLQRTVESSMPKPEETKADVKVPKKEKTPPSENTGQASKQAKVSPPKPASVRARRNLEESLRGLPGKSGGKTSAAVSNPHKTSQHKKSGKKNHTSWK